MAKIEVIGWREGNVGYTGWDNQAKKELTKRLRRALDIAPGEVKTLVKNIFSRQLTVLEGVRETEIESVQQILHTMGADIRVSNIAASPLGVTHMSEKQAIEKATAEGFLVLYNQLQGTDFQIVEMSDAPDVRCVDSLGKTLNLEITTTEDRPGDIKAALGRSNGRSLEALRAHVERVARGEEQPQFSSLSDEVSDQLVERLRSKMMNDYGSNAALVVRDTSGVDWDWDDVIPAIRSRLDLAKNPFSQGIWVLSRVKDRLFQIK